MAFKCISKIGVDILSFSSHVGTLFVSNINALRMLLSSQNINYNSANKFKCPLNTGNPEVIALNFSHCDYTNQNQ